MKREDEKCLFAETASTGGEDWHRLDLGKGWFFSPSRGEARRSGVGGFMMSGRRKRDGNLFGGGGAGRRGRVGK